MTITEAMIAHGFTHKTGAQIPYHLFVPITDTVHVSVIHVMKRWGFEPTRWQVPPRPGDDYEVGIVFNEANDELMNALVDAIKPAPEMVSDRITTYYFMTIDEVNLIVDTVRTHCKEMSK